VDSFLLGDRGDTTSAQKALVVDADPKNLHDMGAALRSFGYETLEAASFEAGKQLWMTEKPSVLVADVRLGQFNGLQLLLRAKTDRPDVLAVITCAFADRVLEAETLRFGGTFVVRPFVAEEVLASIISRAQAAKLERFVERRTADRRGAGVPGFVPERRVTERRRSKTD